jgi:uncharacterized membrane protein
MNTLIITLHSLHLFFAAVWIGSLIYTEAILWPRMRAIGQLELVQGTLRTVQVRQLIGVSIVGTIVTGYARGVVDGVFDRLFSTYSVLFLTAAALGIAMLMWWVHFPTRDRKIGWFLFYSSFPVIFALMIALRFTAAN